MKLVWSLCFLLGSLSTVILGSKIQKTQMQALRGERVPLVSFLLSGMFLVISFVQFWFLTDVFPAKLILLLLFASATTILLFSIVGAVSGITLPEKQRKIGALTVIFSAQQSKLNTASGCALLLVWFVATLGTLWVYWTHPVGSPTAKVLIAFSHFTLTPVVGTLVIIALAWPIVTSESLDDDFRNARLSAGFASIIENTILLLFPFWLLSREITHVFGSRKWPVPPFWLLLLVPLLLFLLGNLVPFFVGLYRYRAQMRAMGEWLDQWLQDLSDNLTLPEGSLREKVVDESLAELKQEIQSRFSENTLFHYYQQLELPDMEAEERPLLDPAGGSLALPAPVEPPDAAKGDPPLEAAAIISDPEQNAIIEARKFLRGHVLPKHLVADPPARADLQEQMLEIIRENRRHLVDWDIRFDYLDRTLKLYEVVREAKTKNISAFIDKQIKENDQRLKDLSPRRNVLAGTSLTVLSSLLVWLIKKYAPDLSSLIETLVAGS